MILPLALPLPFLLEISVVAGVYALIARRPKPQRKRELLTTTQAGSSPAVSSMTPAAR